MDFVFDTTFLRSIGAFVERAERHGLRHRGSVTWRPAAMPTGLPGAWSSLAVDGTWAWSLLEAPEGWGLLERKADDVRAMAACSEPGQVPVLLDRLRRLVPEADPPPETHVRVRFWWHTDEGAAHRSVMVPGHAWPEVRANYAPSTRTALDALIAGPPGTDEGRLVVWNGDPGTGKTHALRALSWHWRDRCTVETVVDAERALAGGPGYLLEVLDQDDGRGRKKLLVIEDGGHLLEGSDDGRAALGRLLNLVDGLLGEVHDPRVLITTNLPAAALDPAATRAGRCAALVTFELLEPEEANAWLAARGCEARVHVPASLADLHALAAGRELRLTRRTRVGFTRAA